jgi:hypothetical protein
MLQAAKSTEYFILSLCNFKNVNNDQWKKVAMVCYNLGRPIRVAVNRYWWPLSAVIHRYLPFFFSIIVSSVNRYLNSIPLFLISLNYNGPGCSGPESVHSSHHFELGHWIEHFESGHSSHHFELGQWIQHFYSLTRFKVMRPVTRENLLIINQLINYFLNN